MIVDCISAEIVRHASIIMSSLWVCRMLVTYKKLSASVHRIIFLFSQCVSNIYGTTYMCDKPNSWRRVH